MADDGFSHYGPALSPTDGLSSLHEGRKEFCKVCDPDPTNLNELAASIHRISQEKGFWEGERNPGEVLMLIVSEAAEALEDIRDGKPLDELLFTADLRGVRKPAGVPSEMADILIRVLDACAAWDIDIDRAVREKVEYNRTRPALHGRAR